MFRSLKEFRDYTLHAKDKQLNASKDILFDDRNWVIRYLVVDPHRWLPGSRKVLLSPLSIYHADWNKGSIYLDLTEQQIKNSPALDENEPVSREYEKGFFRYYGYGFYWMGSGLWGTLQRPDPIVNEDDHNLSEIEENNHLRSFKEILNYSIEAENVNIGTVVDFAFSPREWGVDFLIVRSNDNDKRLLRTDLIDKIDCESKTILLNKSAEAVEKTLDEAVA